MVEQAVAAGRYLFGVVMLLAWIAASLQVAVAPRRRAFPTEDTFADLRAPSIVAAALALAQLAFLAIAYLVPGCRQIAGVGWFYLICTVPVPFLWAAGKSQQQPLGWPLWHGRFTRRQIWAGIAAIAAVGLGLSLILFSMLRVEAGAAVTDISQGARSTSALMLVVIWLVFNAPWIEELTFRHYLLPALARWFGGRPTAVAAAILLTSLVFAAGHAAHMQPAWPKLLQVFTWGIALGCVRVWVGTLYCIALHLAWNLSAPILAALV